MILEKRDYAYEVAFFQKAFTFAFVLRIPTLINLFKESGYNSDRKNIQMRSQPFKCFIQSASLFPNLYLLRRRGFAGIVLRNDVEGTGRKR